MRGATLFGLACVLTVAVAWATPSRAADKPHVELKDEDLALQEIRPLDRHVYILTLDGKWNQPVQGDVKHYINIFFPNGKSVAHRVQDETMFRKGEVRCVIMEYELIDNGEAKGGDFWIVVSERNPVDSPTANDAISDPLKITWPLERVIVTRPVRTRFTPRAPIDAMPLADDPLLQYPPIKPK